MLIGENNTYKTGKYIVAAFGYESLKCQRLFQKVSNTTYRLVDTSKVVNYRSLTTMVEARKNESI